MGLIRARWKILGLFLLNTVFSQCVAADTVTLETQPWPAERACDACVTIQFMTLEMRLPLTEVGKVLAIGGPELHVLPRSGAPKESVLFVAIPPERLLKAFERDGLLRGLDIKTNERLFDTIGKLPGKSRSIARLRQIEGINTAAWYTKASNGPVHVYRIQHSLPGNSQKIYFVIDNEEMVYMLAGNVTQTFYEAVLSNLRIEKIP